jgi:MSHA pilin protein MshA
VAIPVRNEKGFTLIEIIAVLVILGILAAVAIPKYISLQEDAARRSADLVVASYLSAASMKYAEYLLSNGSPTNFPCPAASEVEYDGTIFTVTADNAGATSGDCGVTVTHVKAGTAGDATGTWLRPTP